MSSISFDGSPLGGPLSTFLTCAEIAPGDEPSYQACKAILQYHPLGAKMARSPVKLAQSQLREVSVQAGPASDMVREAFEDEWKALNVDAAILNVKAQSRAYGVASVAVVTEDSTPTDRPIRPESWPDLKIAFNVFDPLNTAGSLVLNQNPNAFDFQKATNGVRVMGTNYHPSRVNVVLNEEPIYISYTTSAFGYVGRSVYQRALYPLKSFVQTMLTDDMITRKAGVLISKQESPGSIIDNVMGLIAGVKRGMVRDAVVGNVLSIGVNEEITTLNMQNLDGAYGIARTNVLKNIATSADMPAWFLENETMVAGFGEGTEDAKNIAHYIDGLRTEMGPTYAFFDEIVRRRAWSVAFYERVKKKFPEYVGSKGYAQMYYDWSNSFDAPWPNLLTEPDSEKAKTEDVKLKGVIAAVEAIAPLLDPENKATLLAWAADNLNQNKVMFQTELVLDEDAIRNWQPPTPPNGEAEPGEPAEPKPMSAAA
jgi:hypothetical protein